MIPKYGTNKNNTIMRTTRAIELKGLIHFIPLV
jgi:hypothetical protein